MNENQPAAVLYHAADRVARITLNRPEKLNAIDEEMPALLHGAVDRANADPDVHVIILSGAGRAFCSGYDLELFAESPRPCPGSQEMPWDPMADFKIMHANTKHFMSLWHSHKPVICKLHGFAVAGGSDIALCCDVVVMAETARIGYPPARVWGCPQTAMWVYRVGPEQAKRLLLTGDLIDGREAARIGLISRAVPEDDLEKEVAALARRMAGVPLNQLMMQKLMINQALANMGLETTQMIATLFDGISRHTPEGVAFKARAEAVGFRQAVAERDCGERIFPVTKPVSGMKDPK